MALAVVFHHGLEETAASRGEQLPNRNRLKCDALSWCRLVA